MYDDILGKEEEKKEEEKRKKVTLAPIAPKTKKKTRLGTVKKKVLDDHSKCPDCGGDEFDCECDEFDEEDKWDAGGAKSK